MTFSIAATDGTAAGVAVASKFLAVGSVVPAARLAADGGESSLVGAVATQAMAKWSYRADALDLLSAGADAASAVAEVTAADDGREHRQLGVVATDSQATYTGSECMAWAGGRSGADASGRYAIQGNILVGEQVVVDMERAWLASAGMPFARRLLAALLAGDAAGGDSRGRQGGGDLRRRARGGLRRQRRARRPARRRPSRRDHGARPAARPQRPLLRDRRGRAAADWRPRRRGGRPAGPARAYRPGRRGARGVGRRRELRDADDPRRHRWQGAGRAPQGDRRAP